MNVCLLANHGMTGGITSYILTLVKELRRSGHAVWVVSAPGDCVPLLADMGVQHVPMNIRVKSELHPNLWLSVPALARLVRDRRIDILHANTRVTQVLAAAVSTITGCPFVSTCHGFFKPRMFRRMLPCWGRGTIAISRGVQAHLTADFRVPPERVTLIANGVDLDRFHAGGPVARQAARERWRINGKPVVGAIARFSPVKGLDVLLRAVPEVLKKFPGAAVVIAGNGPEKPSLVRLATELGVAGAVQFEEVVRETAALLPAFDVFVVPSRQEGLGLSAMEAQAAGVPVVAANVGGLPDLVEDGRSGVLFPAEDSAALAREVVKVLASPGEAMALAAEARMRVEERFSARQMGERTISFYEQHLRR